MSGATWSLDYENEAREITLSVCPGDLEGTVHIHLEDEKGEPISASLDRLYARDVAAALISYAWGVDTDMIRDALTTAVEPTARKADKAKDWVEFWSGE